MLGTVPVFALQKWNCPPGRAGSTGRPNCTDPRPRAKRFFMLGAETTHRIAPGFEPLGRHIERAGGFRSAGLSVFDAKKRSKAGRWRSGPAGQAGSCWSHSRGRGMWPRDGPRRNGTGRCVNFHRHVRNRSHFTVAGDCPAGTLPIFLQEKRDCPLGKRPRLRDLQIRPLPCLEPDSIRDAVVRRGLVRWIRRLDFRAGRLHRPVGGFVQQLDEQSLARGRSAAPGGSPPASASRWSFR